MFINMVNSEVFIVKRDGKKELFSLAKIKNAISKAFLSVGSFATQEVITHILSRVNISDSALRSRARLTRGLSLQPIKRWHLWFRPINFARICTIGSMYSQSRCRRCAIVREISLSWRIILSKNFHP